MFHQQHLVQDQLLENIKHLQKMFLDSRIESGTELIFTRLFLEEQSF